MCRAEGGKKFCLSNTCLWSLHIVLAAQMDILAVSKPFFKHQVRNSKAVSLQAARALPSAVLPCIKGAECAACSIAKPVAGTAAMGGGREAVAAGVSGERGVSEMCLQARRAGDTAVP